MGIDPPFAKSLAAALALLWLALIAVALPAPEANRFFPNLRLRPRLAILGALAFGMLFAGIAAWEHGGVPALEELVLPGWGAAFEGPSRTLSSGAAFVAIGIVLAGIGGWIGPRSRVAARGAMLFVVVLLAGAIWPAFSIPRWCAWLGAPDDLPAPLPLAAYRPDYDPARWMDAWSRVLHPLAAWGMGFALAGVAAGVVLFRRATVRADAPGREAACAAVACAGLLAMCGAALEFEKQAAWSGYAARREDATVVTILFTRLYNSDSEVDSFLLEPRASVSVTEADLDLVRPFRDEASRHVDAPSEPAPGTEVFVDVPGTDLLQDGITWSFPAGGRRYLPSSSITSDSWCPPLPEPDITRPVSTPFPWLALGVGFFAVLFGEFHLRGRRLLRDPVTNLPAPEAV